MVEAECTHDLRKPGAQRILKAIQQDSLTVINTDKIEIDNNINMTFPKFLGAGERAAIELAYSLKYPLLIDDLWGRKVANHYDIPILGTAGLLILAKESNIIPKVSPLLKDLSDVGYHLSQKLIQKIASICGE